MEPAARRPAPGPQSGAETAPLSVQAKGTFASTGEQAVNNGRQLSYAAGVVTGRQVKGANAGVDSSATLPTKNGASEEGKGGRDVKSSRRTPPETKSHRGENDVTVGITAGGHLISTPSHSTSQVLTNTRCIQTPRPVQLFGEPIQWVDTARYLDARLTWSAHVNQVGRKAAQRLGVLGLLLNRRSGLSIKNGVLLYKQLVRPITDYASPIWRSAAHTHIRKLHLLQSKCLRIATNALWYVSNRPIHDDLGISFFADHFREL
jgi:hypothetical protein